MKKIAVVIAVIVASVFALQALRRTGTGHNANIPPTQADVDKHRSDFVAAAGRYLPSCSRGQLARPSYTFTSTPVWMM
jgi:hypothetical protein